MSSIPDWTGRTVAILATGPSLRSAQVDACRAAGCKVVAIKGSYRLAAGADDWVFATQPAWLEYNPEALACKGLVTCIKDFTGRTPAGALLLDVPEQEIRPLMPDSAGPIFNGVGQLVTGGLSALVLALLPVLKSGARRLILLGVDGRHDAEGRGHWYEAPRTRDPLTTRYNQRDERNYRAVLPLLEELGVEVVNCSPGTVITAFPTADLEDVLARLARAGEHPKLGPARRSRSWRPGQA